jgi:hypothetical protein
MVEDSPAARTPISDELRAQIRAVLAAFPQGLPASRTVLFSPRQNKHSSHQSGHVSSCSYHVQNTAGQDHRLNMELDLQSLFVHLYSLAD